MTAGKEILHYLHPESDGPVSTSFIADITDTGEGFELLWSDGVANEWVETYPTIDVAFARIALLVWAVENDTTFRDDVEAFYRRWSGMDWWQLFAADANSAPFGTETT